MNWFYVQKAFLFYGGSDAADSIYVMMLAGRQSGRILYYDPASPPGFGTGVPAGWVIWRNV